MSYDKERADWYAGVPAPTRCTRNMPLETKTVLDAAGVECKSVDGGRSWKQDWFPAGHAPIPEWVRNWPTEDSTAPNEPTIGIDMNKYQRKLTKPTYVQRESQCDPSDLASIDEDVIIDVYDVLDAFDVTNPATAHAIKKLLCTGSRGAKDWETDLQEAIDSLERAKSFPPMPF
jgi:hypothetical protein